MEDGFEKKDNTNLPMIKNNTNNNTIILAFFLFTRLTDVDTKEQYCVHCVQCFYKLRAKFEIVTFQRISIALTD